jgi:hypothetical protein
MSNKEIKVTPDKEVKDITVLCADNSYTKDYIKQQGTSSILITKGMFNRYRQVQYNGDWNMMMDWEEAANDAELAPPAYWSIINNYSQLADHYGDFASQPSDDYDEDLDPYYDR